MPRDEAKVAALPVARRLLCKILRRNIRDGEEVLAEVLMMRRSRRRSKRSKRSRRSRRSRRIRRCKRNE